MDNASMPEKSAQEEPAKVDLTDWRLVLVNFETPLEKAYTPPKLTALNHSAGVDSRIYPDLQAMMDAARAAGLDPLVCSSYRTREKQQRLYENKVQVYVAQGHSRAEAEKQAAEWVARPGTSEHETGLAVDVVSKSYQLLDERQAETQVQKWLMEHCAEFGFILRYPQDKADLTGVRFEPWHYRYVGRAIAREIMERGICLEEYLAGS